MKQLKKVALAAAVACVAAGNAFAVVDLDAGTGAVAYAKELLAASTSLRSAALDATVKLGFGVSTGQTRYIRFDLGNGKWAFNLGAEDLVVDGGAGTDASVNLSAGGTTADSYVIFQITAGNLGHASTNTVDLDIGAGNAGDDTISGVVITAPTSNVTLTYSLYETAADAVNGTGTGRLAVQANKNLATSTKSTQLVVTVEDSATADVDTGYKQFTSGTSESGVAPYVLARIGQVTHGLIGSPPINPATGAAVTMAQLFGAASKLVITTDANLTSLAAANGSLFLSSDATCGGTAVGDLAASRTATTSDLVTGSTAVTTQGICYTADNTDAIATQTFKVSTVNTAGTAGTADNESVQTLGSFDRDGTVLKAVFPEAAAGGFSNSVHLTNTGSTDVTFTTVCYSHSGKTNGTGTGMTILANQAARIGVTSASGLGCPAATRAVELTMPVSSGTVLGSAVRLNTTTGVASYEKMIGSVIIGIDGN